METSKYQLKKEDLEPIFRRKYKIMSLTGTYITEDDKQKKKEKELKYILTGFCKVWYSRYGL